MQHYRTALEKTQEREELRELDPEKVDEIRDECERFAGYLTEKLKENKTHGEGHTISGQEFKHELKKLKLALSHAVDVLDVIVERLN